MVTKYSDRATVWTPSELYFSSCQGQEVFLFSKTFGLALGYTLSLYQWITGLCAQRLSSQDMKLTSDLHAL